MERQNQLRNARPQYRFMNYENSIYVSPLPFGIQEYDLKFLFSLCGSIKLIRIYDHPPPNDSCYAFIEFSCAELKQKAKKFYHGKKLGLTSICVQSMRNTTHSGVNKFQNYKRNNTYLERQPAETQVRKKVHKNDDQETLSKPYQNYARKIPNQQTKPYNTYQSNSSSKFYKNHDKHHTHKYHNKQEQSPPGKKNLNLKKSSVQIKFIPAQNHKSKTSRFNNHQDRSYDRKDKHYEHKHSKTKYFSNSQYPKKSKYSNQLQKTFYEDKHDTSKSFKSFKLPQQSKINYNSFQKSY